MNRSLILGIFAALLFSTMAAHAHRYDAETGLYYCRARYYDPNLGRFLSRDPIGYRDCENLYVYVRNNPAKYVDPSGLRIEIPNAKDQAKLLGLMNAICKEGAPWVMVGGQVKSSVNNFCEKTCPNAKRKIACNLLCDLIRAPDTIKLKTRQFPGGKTGDWVKNPNNDNYTVEIEVGVGRAAGVQGFGGMVPEPDEWVLLHELIGHVWPNVATGDYTLTGNETTVDPTTTSPKQALAIELENQARAEAGMSQRDTGNGLGHAMTGKQTFTPPDAPPTSPGNISSTGPVPWNQFVPGSFPPPYQLLPNPATASKDFEK